MTIQELLVRDGRWPTIDGPGLKNKQAFVCAYRFRPVKNLLIPDYYADRLYGISTPVDFMQGVSAL